MPIIKQKTFLFSSIAVALCLATTNAFAQSTQSDGAAWVGVVSSENAPVRCGANESYYPIANIRGGDLLLVNGKRQGWLKVETSGNVFKDAIGYVKYPAQNTTTLLVTGTSGEVLSDIEVLAKNVESEELYRSWRPICRLKNGETIDIISSVTTDPGTLHRESYVVHTVRMPASGGGWIRASSVSRATDEQVASFYGGPSATVNTTRGEGAGDASKIAAQGGTTGVGGGATGFAVEVNTSEVSETTEAQKLEPLSLVELEARWDVITAEPIMGAELSTLTDMYRELLSENQGDLVVEQVAGGRIKQLEVWERLQAQKLKIEELKEKMAARAGEVDEYQSIIASYGEYVVVGRLALSNTFDGKLRPLMFRVLDKKSGRTLGYLPANKDFELSGLLGQIIGVTGKSEWSPSWRVNVVRGERFDILSPTTAIVSPDIQ